jgi:hypothetical protein
MSVAQRILVYGGRMLALTVLASAIAGVSTASAAILYESGTLGTTGVSWSDLEAQSVPGTNISQFAFNGVRFKLDQPALTTEVGGHFVAPTTGTFFGVIVELSGENDFPDSADLSTADVLGRTLLSFPTSSAEVFADLSLSLDPGWYALVFGSGLFEATAHGGAVRNGIDIGDPSYISYGRNLGWFNLDIFQGFFDNHRFVVRGSLVPEPSATALCALC